MSKAFNRFAHLVGLRARADEPDQDDQTADNNDPDNNAGDDDQEPQDPEEQNSRAKGKKAKKAKTENDPDDPNANDDDPDAEDGDDETDAEDEDDDTTAKARARERGRCAAIFGCKEAANNLPLAAELAFGTNMPRSQAIRVLKSGSIGQPNSTGRSAKISAYDQKMMRSRQTVSIGTPKASQNLSPSAMAANRILQSAAGTGVVRKDNK